MIAWPSRIDVKGQQLHVTPPYRVAATACTALLCVHTESWLRGTCRHYQILRRVPSARGKRMRLSYAKSWNNVAARQHTKLYDTPTLRNRMTFSIGLTDDIKDDSKQNLILTSVPYHLTLRNKFFSEWLPFGWCAPTPTKSSNCGASGWLAK
jgi:hypothetical protein